MLICLWSRFLSAAAIADNTAYNTADQYRNTNSESDDKSSLRIEVASLATVGLSFEVISQIAALTLVNVLATVRTVGHLALIALDAHSVVHSVTRLTL